MRRPVRTMTGLPYWRVVDCRRSPSGRRAATVFVLVTSVSALLLCSRIPVLAARPACVGLWAVFGIFTDPEC